MEILYNGQQTLLWKIASLLHDRQTVVLGGMPIQSSTYNNPDQLILLDNSCPTSAYYYLNIPLIRADLESSFQIDQLIHLFRNRFSLVAYDQSVIKFSDSFDALSLRMLSKMSDLLQDRGRFYIPWEVKGGCARMFLSGPLIEQPPK